MIFNQEVGKDWRTMDEELLVLCKIDPKEPMNYFLPWAPKKIDLC